jgi:hypothetical protein
MGEDWVDDEDDNENYHCLQAGLKGGVPHQHSSDDQTWREGGGRAKVVQTGVGVAHNQYAKSAEPANDRGAAEQNENEDHVSTHNQRSTK